MLSSKKESEMRSGNASKKAESFVYYRRRSPVRSDDGSEY
jgi:hypothetical protein